MKAIDIHVHGFRGADTRGGAASVMRVARAQAQAGVAAFLPTIYPGPVEAMRHDMEVVRRAMQIQSGKVQSREAQPRDVSSARILGVHIEGPFLSPACAGALDARSFLSPTPSAFRNLISGYEDIIKIITVAPELKGALKVIERACALGIRVSMGHSDATYKQAMDGKRAGAACVTHLFNAMRPIHHREPGLAGLGLMDDDLYVEVIADGVHLLPETLSLVFRIKPKERVIVVSDAVAGPMRRRGVLQGGALPLPRMFSLLASLGVSDRRLDLYARRNAARYLGLGRGSRRGATSKKRLPVI